MWLTCAYCVDAFEIGCYGHLFVELRRLRQICVRLEVAHSEHISATLRCSFINYYIMYYYYYYEIMIIHF